MQINKYKNLGSGWHSESQRHSNARKFGIAGGIYASQLPIYKIGNKFYFRDERLGEYRDVNNPNNKLDINIDNSKLQKSTWKEFEEYNKYAKEDQSQEEFMGLRKATDKEMKDIKKKQVIGKDLKFNVASDIDSVARDHLIAWKERYRGKSKEDVRQDLFINHDNDAQVELEEHHLKRKLNDKEREYFISQFIKAVVRNYNKQGLYALKDWKKTSGDSDLMIEFQNKKTFQKILVGVLTKIEKEQYYIDRGKNKYFKGGFNKTINFKSHSEAVKFVKDYMKKH